MYTSEGLDITAVTARKLCPRPLWEQVPRIVNAGITRIILREKDLSPDEYTALAERVLKACEDCGAELTIHGFPEAARKLGTERLHMPLPRLTAELCREFGTVGTSVHSGEQLMQAEALGVSYVIAGHIFATDCKRGLEPRGLGFLADICKRTALPVYAIGGITTERLCDIKSAGSVGACIMSAAMKL